MSLKNVRKKLVHYGQSGQALVEYVLLLVLIAILFGVTLAATGPAIGNVFSNMVFNLLGQDPASVVDLSTGRGDSSAFWATVEWVAANPPVDAPAPTGVYVVPPTATDGPAPTATPLTPTLTPSNTATQGPTATPVDFDHVAPWLDTIDNPEWWRVDKSVWIGGDDWLGQYYPNTTLSGTPDAEFYNGALGNEYRFGINFNWPSGSGPIAGWLTDNFSVRWTRQIYIQGPDPLEVRFTTVADDGVRLWLNYEAGCAGVNSGGPATGSTATYPSGCLIIDNWRGQGATTMSVVRTLPPGFHTLQLDYFEGTSSASVSLAIEALANQGGVVGDSTIPAGGTPQCSWSQSNTSNSNSRMFMWEEQANGDFPANTRCYLELRGSVDVSALTSPKLVFWDVWHLAATSSVWIEVAEYNANPAARNWQRINLRSGGTSNYNWTRNVLDLSSIVSGYGTRKVALRFGMESTSTSSPRRWYVDDIELRDFDNTTKFLTVCNGTGSTPAQRKASCGTYWDLNSPAQKADFIYSGRWDLTNNAGQTGTGWDSNAETTNYDRNSEGSPRVHSLELNGWVDLRAPNLPDADGDDGAPQLSFFHRYSIARGDSITLQWTRDPFDLTPDNWQTFETLVSVSSSGSTVTEATMQFREVLLTTIPNWNTQPFRLRFALTVDGSTESTGWKIDNIYLERLGRPRFTDYPFFDDAESGTDNWLMEGQWSTTTSQGLFGSANSFTDSPNGNYTHGTNASMSLRYPIDFNNDTPANINEYFDNNPSGGNTQVAPATRPMLTFWFWRDLASSDHLILEWSKNLGVSWTQAWAYNYNSTTGRNNSWERIVVDLSPLVAGTQGNANLTDDDVLFRFRLDARTNSSVLDGVYIDNIDIRDYSELSFKLWDPSVNSPTGGTGNGIRHTDDIEGNWFNRWHVGGDWTAITYEQRQGLRSFHESAPENTNTRHLTYQVLEMDRIIDLRGTTINDRPTLYWWNRYDVGSGDTISVEIATENTGYVRSSSEGNYQRQTGWNAWSTGIWQLGAGSRVDTWVREQVSLDSYVGSRIRIRFVYNAYSNSSNRDGWYIDDVRVEHRKPAPINLPFLDPAQSMTNWVGEGVWGLAPDQWRGSGGGPASLGTDFWTGVFYDCERVLGRGCNTVTDFNTLLYENFAAGTMRPYQPGRDLQTFSVDVFHDFGSNGLPPGSGGDSTWLDRYAARWIRPITVQAGDYTFITVSDDGVRLRYTCDAPCVAPPGWNIINNWSFHGRTVDIASVNFQTGNYTLILEWFESTGGATIILSAGKNNFSFTDSPKAGNGPAFPVVNSVPYGNSSLILNRPLNLAGSFLPVLEFYTRYRLGGTGRVELTINGGFDWTQANMNSSADGFTCPVGSNCSNTVSGTYWPADPGDWRQHQLNLSSYKSYGLIGLRFRLQTSGSVNDGWYITDIQVNAASIAP